MTTLIAVKNIGHEPVEVFVIQNGVSVPVGREVLEADGSVGEYLIHADRFIIIEEKDAFARRATVVSLPPMELTVEPVVVEPVVVEPVVVEPVVVEPVVIV